MFEMKPRSTTSQLSKQQISAMIRRTKEAEAHLRESKLKSNREELKPIRGPWAHKRRGPSRKPKNASVLLSKDGDVRNTVFNFGRHAGMSFREVPREYIQWCFDVGIGNRGMQIAVATFLGEFVTDTAS